MDSHHCIRYIIRSNYNSPEIQWNYILLIFKAAGLCHARIVEYLLKIWPKAVNEPDRSGRTPLHWAQSAKNNNRSINLLLNAGADEEVLDNVSNQWWYIWLWWVI